MPATNGTCTTFEDRIPHSPEKDIPGDNKRWIVQKYGGTSVGKFAVNIADIIANGLVKDNLAVVVSARSSHNKAEGTTSRLLRSAKAAERRDGTQRYTDTVQVIEADHLKAAQNTIRDESLLKAYSDRVHAELHALQMILDSAHHLEEVSAKVEDKIIGIGERLSAIYMTALLNDRGVPAQNVDLSYVVEEYDVDATLTKEGAYQALAIAMGKAALSIKPGHVPVITGYFGHVHNGILQTIGRGYTDLAAALVAIGIAAGELQIWKEVDGIFTSDPRRCPTAQLLPSVLPSEAAELTYYGSEVIHPFTMAQVMLHSIPIRIKNVMNPRGSGTVIIPEPAEVNDPLRPKLTRGRSSLNLEKISHPRPTAVTIKPNIVVLNIHSNRRTRQHGFLARIFSVLDKHNLSVDLISSSEVHVSMALHSEVSMVSTGLDEELSIKDRRLQGAYDDLSELGTVDLVVDMAIISLVGKQLKRMVGIAGKFFSVLGDNSINIEMISQGASEINISCVISQRDSDRALSVVHTHLFDFLDI